MNMFVFLLSFVSFHKQKKLWMKEQTNNLGFMLKVRDIIDYQSFFLICFIWQKIPSTIEIRYFVMMMPLS
jgi:hypothetical protein